MPQDPRHEEPGAKADEQTRTRPSAHAPAGVEPGGAPFIDIGARLHDGRLEVVNYLGSGGMGTVYEARELSTGRRVAVKALAFRDAAGIFAFKQEFRSLADIVHPNLVRLHELFSENDGYYIRMDLVAGPDFLGYVRPEGRLDLDRLQAAMAQLTAGVDGLHAAAKLHRDLKPANVLVTRDGLLQILDFGLVTSRSASLEPDAIDSLAGTPQYMAPEQTRGQVSEASDLYAIGVMLFQALTGRLPLQGNPLRVLERKRVEDPPAPIDLVPELPRELSELCMALLDRNPQRRATARDLYQRFGRPERRLQVRPSPTGELSLSFVGRQVELRELQRALHRTALGQPVLLYVHGQSGVGKSSLVEHFAQDAERREQALVLRGRCYEREHVGFKAFDSLIDELTRHLRRLPIQEASALVPRNAAALLRLFPVLRDVTAFAGSRGRGELPPEPQHARRMAFDALKQLFRTLSERQPLVLWVDDLQWGDQESAQLLQALVSGSDAPALLMVGTYRSDDAEESPCLRALLSREELAHAPTPRVIELDGLDAQQATELVRRLSPDRSEHEALRLGTEARGNPLMLTALLDALEPSGAGAAAQLPDHISFRSALAARVATLGEPTRELLQLLSAIGQPVEQALVGQMLPGRPDLDRELAVLRTARIVRSARTPDHITLYHDRIRETVYEGMTEPVRRQLHGRIADALAQHRPEALDPRTEHLLRAGRTAQAAGLAARAAEQACAALAFERGVALYRIALEHGAHGEDERRALLSRFGEALVNAGRSQEAARVFFQAADGARGAQAIELRCKAACELLVGGKIDEGLEALRGTLFAIDVQLPDSPELAQVALFEQRARLLERGFGFDPQPASRLSQETLLELDTFFFAAFGITKVDSSGLELVVRYLLRALEIGEPYRVLKGLSLYAILIEAIFGPTETVQQRIEEVAASLDDPNVEGWVEGVRGNVQLVLMQPERALPHLWRAERLLRERCTGVYPMIASNRNSIALALGMMGRVRELGEVYASWHAEARRREDVVQMTQLTLACNQLWFADDDVEGGRDSALSTLERWRQATRRHADTLGMTAMFLELGWVTFGAADGWQSCCKVRDAFLPSVYAFIPGFRYTYFYLHGSAALWLAARQPAHAEALAAAEQDAAELDKLGMVWADGKARLLRAGVANVRGETHRAAELLREALAVLDGRQLAHAAAARLYLGRLLGGEQGEALIAEGQGFLDAQGLRNPERYCASLVPGFA